MKFKLFFLLFVYFFMNYSNVFSLTANEIMKKVDERDTGTSAISSNIMILIDKKKRERIREIQLFVKEYSEVEKSISFFLSPADVKNTSFLSYDWVDKNKEDDSWLYLPALQRVNRIASADKDGSWMGSDFTISDVEGLDINDSKYKIISDNDIVDGFECWKIESLPKNESVIEKTGYLKSILWIRKDNFFQVRGVIDVKKGKKVKYFSAKDIELINGIWTAKTLQMVTTKNKKVMHSSIFKIKDINYNVKIEDGLFEVESMQRGL